MTTPDVEKAAEEFADSFKKDPDEDIQWVNTVRRKNHFKVGVAWARANPPVTQGESAEAMADRIGRDKDKNNNPDVFSRWSFLAGRASAEGEIKSLCDSFDEMQKMAHTGYSRGLQHGLEERDALRAEVEELKRDLANAEERWNFFVDKTFEAEAERDALRASVAHLVELVEPIPEFLELHHKAGTLHTLPKLKVFLARFRKGG